MASRPRCRGRAVVRQQRRHPPGVALCDKGGYEVVVGHVLVSGREDHGVPILLGHRNIKPEGQPGVGELVNGDPPGHLSGTGWLAPEASRVATLATLMRILRCAFS